MSFYQRHSYTPTPIPCTEQNWEQILTTPLSSRMHYESENGSVTYGQLTAYFKGVPYEKEEYYNRLYSLKEDPSYRVHAFHGNLEKAIDPAHRSSLHTLLERARNENLSVNRLLGFLKGDPSKLIPSFSDNRIQRTVEEALKKVMTHFIETHPGGFRHEKTHRFLMDLVKWSHNHLHAWKDEMVPEENMPKVLWYGEAKESQLYFLVFLFYVGCDLLIFEPTELDLFASFPDVKEALSVISYPERETEILPFPTEKLARARTVAYQASAELSSVIHHENSGFYRPWQFRQYEPKSLTLKTTYDEVFILGKELARIRPNFVAEKQQVVIPSIFAKIAGVSRNKNEYWKQAHSLYEQPLVTTLDYFPFTKESTQNYILHYRKCLGSDGKLIPEKMMEGNFWGYQRETNHVQEAIAHAIRRCCEKPKLQPLRGETMEQLQLYMFTQLVDIPDKFITLLQQFDYAQVVPKVLVYNNGTRGVLSRSDAAVLLLLHELGMDVVIWNPSGQVDLEEYVEEKWFDIHWLEEMVFEQPFKPQSIFKKWIKKITD